MKGTGRKVASLVMLIAFFISILGPNAFAANNTANSGTNQKKLLQQTVAAADAGVEMDARKYDLQGLELYTKAIDSMKPTSGSPGNVVDNTAEAVAIDMDEDFQKAIKDFPGIFDPKAKLGNVEDLLTQFRDEIKPQYMNPHFNSTDKLLEIKQKLATYAYVVVVSGKCSDETTLLFANALKDFYIADKIICKSDLNDFKNIIKGIKDPKLKIKTMLLQTVAQNMMNSADRHLKKGLVVPPAVEYRICHRQYVDALKLNGIVFVRTTVIELDQTEITLKVGDTLKLNAKVLPDNATNKNVIWSSSDESILTVTQDGIIKAVKDGIAAITATSEDNSFEARCNVKVVLPFTVSLKDSLKGIEVTWDNMGDGTSYALYRKADSEEYRGIASNLADTRYVDSNVNEKIKYFYMVTATTSTGGQWHSNEGSIIHLTDIDGDGLPDLFEELISTDPNLPDTDGDGLPDGYEYNLLQTNPAEKDTDKNGTEDGQEDLDLDELANAQEYSAGTNPLVADTDLDGLLDAEEINVYQTNPLLYDTDGDGLSDGDEVKLGLSPLTQYTHDGILDSEYKVEQNLPEEALTAINTEDNDYELSIDIKAAGCVENNIAANESIYSDTLMENRAILGVAADLGYYDGAIESAKLKFQIKAPFVDNTGSIYAANDEELVGIKRYNIFKYFADDNMLLPIKTHHDVENGIVYAEVKELGTYCVMDLEKWLYDMGISPEETTPFLPAVTSLKANLNDDAPAAPDQVNPNNIKDEIPSDYRYMTLDELNSALSPPDTMRALAVRSSSVNQPVDIVFVVDTTGSMGSAINNVKINIGNVITTLYDQGITPYVSVVDYTDYRNMGTDGARVVKKADGNYWAYNKEEAIELVSKLDIRDGWDETPVDALEMARTLIYRSGATKFVVLVTDEGCNIDNRYGVSGLTEMANLLNNDGKITCVVTSSYLQATYAILNQTTDGNWLDIYSDFSPQLRDFIISKIQTQKRYPAVVSSGLYTVSLNEPLSKGGPADSDQGGLTDSDEVDWTLITTTVDGEVNLPTLGELMTAKTGYSDDGLARIKLNRTLLASRVLPIRSDPNKVDSDGDGIPDISDKRPLAFDLRQALVFQSNRPKGKNADGTKAADMVTGDFSRKQITDIHLLFRVQVDEDPDTLFYEFSDMSTSLFATGEMEKVVLAMIDHAKDGTGADYSNDTLTQKAKDHDTTKEYVDLVKNRIIKELVNNGGNLKALELDQKNKAASPLYQYIQENGKYPVFNTWSDSVGGLRICVNDTWGNNVKVTDYQFDGKNFSGTLHFCIYDHFGLNKPDAEKFASLAGFRAWFVLQHYKQLKGVYDPFATLMEFDIPFSGRVYTWEQG